MEVGKEIRYRTMPLGPHWCENSTPKVLFFFCPLHYNLLPLDTLQIRNILFRITDLTKNSTPAIPKVCTCRMLLLLIVFALL
jgi:hypothetical protein